MDIEDLYFKLRLAWLWTINKWLRLSLYSKNFIIAYYRTKIELLDLKDRLKDEGREK